MNFYGIDDDNVLKEERHIVAKEEPISKPIQAPLKEPVPEKPQAIEDPTQPKKAFNFNKISEEQKKVPEKVEEKKQAPQEDDLFAKFASYDPADKYKAKKPIDPDKEQSTQNIGTVIFNLLHATGPQVIDVV